MANVKFDDYLNNELKNSDFKKGYLTEKGHFRKCSHCCTCQTKCGTVSKTTGKNLQSALVNIIGGVITCNSTYCIFIYYKFFYRL